MSKRNSQEFKALQAKWYSKLKSSGFNDIEQDDGNLKVWSSILWRHAPVTAAAKEEYYRLAGQFLHEYEFSSPVEKLIWQLHSEAVLIRRIVSALKKRHVKPERLPDKGTHYYQKVNNTIRRLAEIMIKRARGLPGE